MKKQLKKIVYYLAISLLIGTSGYAQEEFEDDDTVDVATAAPIDGLVPVAITAAIGLGYFLQRKKTVEK